MNDLYEYSVPALLRGLSGAENILRTSAEFITQKGIDESTFLQSKLAPDMFPFVKQIHAKGAVSRLGGVENPVYPDSEESIAALITRVQTTIKFVEHVQKSSFDDAMDRKIVLPFLPSKYLTAHAYLQEFLLPNFYFHLTTAYGIARMVGVPLTKSDFAGVLSFNDL
jgi:hypothetical protein